MHNVPTEELKPQEMRRSLNFNPVNVTVEQQLPPRLSLDRSHAQTPHHRIEPVKELEGNIINKKIDEYADELHSKPIRISIYRHNAEEKENLGAFEDALDSPSTSSQKKAVSDFENFGMTAANATHHDRNSRNSRGSKDNEHHLPRPSLNLRRNAEDD